MKKLLLTIIFFSVSIIPLFAFTDDFESGNVWTTVSGAVNQSANQNHTSGGQFSLEGFATFSTPAEATRQETSASTTQKWWVEGYVFTNAANKVQFGWRDHSLNNISQTNTWVYVTDTITFSGSPTYNVDFFVTGTGTDAYLDDVATHLIPKVTSVPKELWKDGFDGN